MQSVKKGDTVKFKSSPLEWVIVKITKTHVCVQEKKNEGIDTVITGLKSWPIRSNTCVPFWQDLEYVK